MTRVSAIKPILFSAPMICALLEGRKTRRRLYARKGEDRNALAHIARRLANGLDGATDGECWEWKRSKNNYGYGTLTINGRRAYAHILAFKLAGNDLPTGLHVMHACDNPACINPAHLKAGTRSANMTDCHARGRSRIPRPRMVGETNGSAKLSAAQVTEIRSRLASGEVQRLIAARFGISQTLISAIKRGRVWS